MDRCRPSLPTQRPMPHGERCFSTMKCWIICAERAADRHQGRLRRGRLRRLHHRRWRAARRHDRIRAVNSCLMLVPQLDGCAVIDGRRACAAGRRAASGAASAGRGRRDAMRLLHAGLCDGDVRLRAGRRGARRRTHPRSAGGKSLPLHRLPADRRGLPRACARIRRADEVARRNAPRAAPNTGMAGRFISRRARSTRWRRRAPASGRHLLAGGTDLGLACSKEREQFPAVILTGAVRSCEAIAMKDGVLDDRRRRRPTRGVAVSRQHFPSFAALVRRIGSRQIRNLGTFAGNLADASPIGDTIRLSDGARRRGRAALARGTRRCRWKTSSLGYRKTALGGRAHQSIAIPLLGAARISRLQTVEAVRSGYFDGGCGIPPAGRERNDGRTPGRLWRHGGEDHAREKCRALRRPALDT